MQPFAAFYLGFHCLPKYPVYRCLFCIVWFDSLRPINNLSVKQGRLNRDGSSWVELHVVLSWAQVPQRSDDGEARTRDPSDSSQALYHWAIAFVWDGSFEYPQHMFWLRNEKNIFLVRTLN